MTGQGASVDVVDARDPVAFQVGVERVERTEAARVLRMPAHDESTDPGLLRLAVGVIDAVVSLQRVGHADHLAGIRRIGEDLLVAGHSGVEDHLALAERIGAEGLACEGAAVLQDQGGEPLHWTITARSIPSVSAQSTWIRSSFEVGTFLPT